ncbi:MAG: nickel insertion protein [Geodermatophilaceae bacterium]
MARRPGRAARGRCRRRLADAHPDEEGPAGVHAARAVRPTVWSTPCGGPSSAGRRPSGCAGSRCPSTPWTGRQGVVRVEGHPIRVKIARDAGRVVNVSVEFEDVARLATELEQPVKEVLRAATAAAHRAHPARALVERRRSTSAAQ